MGMAGELRPPHVEAGVQIEVDVLQAEEFECIVDGNVQRDLGVVMIQLSADEEVGRQRERGPQDAALENRFQPAAGHDHVRRQREVNAARDR